MPPDPTPPTTHSLSYVPSMMTLTMIFNTYLCGGGALILVEVRKFLLLPLVNSHFSEEYTEVLDSSDSRGSQEPPPQNEGTRG